MASTCYFGFGIELDPTKDYSSILKEHDEYEYKTYRDDDYPLVRFVAYDPRYDYEKPWTVLIYAIEKANNYVMSASSEHLVTANSEITYDVLQKLDQAHRLFTGKPIEKYKIKLMCVYTLE